MDLKVNTFLLLITTEEVLSHNYNLHLWAVNECTNFPISQQHFRFWTFSNLICKKWESVVFLFPWLLKSQISFHKLLGHCIYFYLGSSFLLIHLCFLNGLLRFLNTLDFSLWCLHLLQIHTSKPRLVSPLFLHVAFLPVFLLMSYAFSRCL